MKLFGILFTGASALLGAAVATSPAEDIFGEAMNKENPVRTSFLEGIWRV